jgi:hypothetical protein
VAGDRTRAHGATCAASLARPGRGGGNSCRRWRRGKQHRPSAEVDSRRRWRVRKQPRRGPGRGRGYKCRRWLRSKQPRSWPGRGGGNSRRRWRRGKQPRPAAEVDSCRRWRRGKQPHRGPGRSRGYICRCCHSLVEEQAAPQLARPWRGTGRWPAGQHARHPRRGPAAAEFRFHRS